MPINKKLLKGIRENSRKLNECKLHKFSGERMSPGNKHTCLNCGGKMKGGDVLYYIAGYEAGGGDCNDIYPNWNGEKNV